MGRRRSDEGAVCGDNHTETLLQDEGLFNYRDRPTQDVGWLAAYLVFLALTVAGGVYAALHRNMRFTELIALEYLNDSAHCPQHQGRALLAERAEGDDVFQIDLFMHAAGTWIAISFAGSLAVGVAFLALVRHYPHTLGLLAIRLQVLIPATLAGVSFMYGSMPIAGFYLVAAAIAGLVFFLWRRQIELVMLLMGVTGASLVANPAVAGVGLLLQVALGVVCAPLLLTMGAAHMSGNVAYNPPARTSGSADGVSCLNADGQAVLCCTWQPEPWAYSFMSFASVSILWTTMLAFEIKVATISGAIAQWYFAPLSGVASSAHGGGSATLRSLRFALGASIGSLCLGSAVLTLVSLMRQVRLAITREACFPAASGALGLLKRNFMDAYGVWFLPGLVLQSCAFLLSAAWGGAFYMAGFAAWQTRSNHAARVSQPFASAVILGIIAFHCSWLVLSFCASILLNVINAAFICFATDRDRRFVSRKEFQHVFVLVPSVGQATSPLARVVRSRSRVDLCVITKEGTEVLAGKTCPVTYKTGTGAERLVYVMDGCTVRDLKRLAGQPFGVPWDQVKVLIGGRVRPDSTRLADCAGPVHIIPALQGAAPVDRDVAKAKLKAAQGQLLPQSKVLDEEYGGMQAALNKVATADFSSSSWQELDDMTTPGAVVGFIKEMLKPPAAAEPPESDVVKFCRLLKNCSQRIKVSDDIMERLMNSFATEVSFAAQANSLELAINVYKRARLLPGTATRATILGSSDIAVNGPLGHGYDYVLSAVHRTTGVPVVLKVLVTQEQHQIANKASELLVYHQKGLLPHGKTEQASVALLPEKLMNVELDHTSSIGLGVFEALLMPRCTLTFDLLPAGMSLSWLAKCGLDVVKALQHMHSFQICHMDVKSTNLFITYCGRCLLGDYGAATKFKEKIHAATENWYPDKLLNKEAEPEMDFGLLATAFATVLLRNRLRASDHVNFAKLKEDKALVHVSGRKVVALLVSASSPASTAQQQKKEEEDFRAFVKHLLSLCKPSLYPTPQTWPPVSSSRG